MCAKNFNKLLNQVEKAEKIAQDVTSKPISFKTKNGKKISRFLTDKESKFVKFRAMGHTMDDSKALAGIKPRKALTLATKEALGEVLDGLGITTGFIAQKIKEGLNAKSLYGKHAIEYPDYSTRHKYLDTAIRLKGLQPTEELTITHNNNIIEKFLKGNLSDLKRYGVTDEDIQEAELVEDDKFPKLKVLEISDKKE
jgi:hypothetical protein